MSEDHSQGKSWLGWLGFSVGLHLLIALLVARSGAEAFEVTIEQAPQSLPIQVAWVQPQPVEVPPPPVVETPPPVIATEQASETFVPEIPEPTPAPEPVAPKPTAETALPIEPKPSLEPTPAEPPQPEAERPEPVLTPEPAPASTPAEAPTPLASAEQLTGGEMRETGPAALINPAPSYPRAAVARGWTGTVWLEVALCPRGYPTDCRVLESSGHAILDRQARHTVLNEWRFQPGQAAERLATIAIEFRLK